MSPLHLPLEAALRAYRRMTPTERGGYRLVRLVRRFRPRALWRDTFRTPLGFEMQLDLGVYPDCCMAFGLYELDTERLIRRLLRPGDRFIDAGANIGYFTLLAASLVGAHGRVDAFEPQPDNRGRLIDHLQRNGLADRVRVHALALGDRESEVAIHYYTQGYNHGSSTLFAQPGANTHTTQVPMRRMDDVLLHSAGECDTDRIRLIKMDIEGAEPLAVAGMTRLLQSEHPPAIICEFNAQQANVAGFAPRETIDRILAAQRRYHVHWVGARLRRIDPTDAQLARLRQGNLLFQVEGEPSRA
jgi:FkbM family methyltransferase